MAGGGGGAAAGGGAFPTDAPKHHLEVPHREVTLADKIGEGAFGIVIAATWRGRRVAGARRRHMGLLSVWGKRLVALGLMASPRAAAAAPD